MSEMTPEDQEKLKWFIEHEDEIKQMLEDEKRYKWTMQIVRRLVIGIGSLLVFAVTTWQFWVAAWDFIVAGFSGTKGD